MAGPDCLEISPDLKRGNAFFSVSGISFKAIPLPAVLLPRSTILLISRVCNRKSMAASFFGVSVPVTPACSPSTLCSISPNDSITFQFLEKGIFSLAGTNVRSVSMRSLLRESNGKLFLMENIETTRLFRTKERTSPLYLVHALLEETSRSRFSTEFELSRPMRSSIVDKFKTIRL